MRVSSGGRSRRVVPALVAGVSVVALAACGSSSKSSSGNSGTATTKPASGGTTVSIPVSTTLGTGVTNDSIKVGVAIVDFSAIQQFIDFNHGDEQATTQVFIDAINKAGGINGRKLVPVYKKYVPIGSTGPIQACTSFTQDEKVFAVLGNIEDPAGAGQKCVSKTHHTVFIGHDLTDAEINAASPPGLMMTPDITTERRLDVLLSLLKKQNTLQGKKVAILAETGTKSQVSDAEKKLKDMGVQTGSTAVIDTGQSGDTTAAQTQLQSFIERWKSEGVNAIVITGADVVAKQFVTQLEKGMPGILLMTGSEASAAGAGQDAVAAHVTPNPYEGMLTANGLNDQAAFETPTVQKCVKTYEDATHTKVIAPKDLKAGPDGKRVQVYVAVEDICRELTLFQQIATKAGQYLNNDNWVAAANSLGHVNDLPYSQFASVTQGKYDADDSYALSSFDSTVNGSGDFKNISPILDANSNS